MILGALAYRSAKKRKLGEVKSTLTRQLVEVALLLGICVVVLGQNNLKTLIATDPVPNFVIPLWAIIAYLIAAFIPWNKANSVPGALIASKSEAPLPDPSNSLQAAGRPITTILALAFLLAVLVGIGAYVYEGSAAGFGRLVGLAIVPSLVLGLVGFSARKSKRSMRWDIGLVAIAFFLIWCTREDIFQTYDVRRFQSELRSAGPADREKVLATSTTQMGALWRGAVALSQEANTKISAIFAELDDPLLENVLTAESLNNMDAINKAETMANEKAAVARTAMQRIDAALANELQQDQKLASEFSETTASDFIQGVEERHVRHRALYQRRADLGVKTLEELVATLAFVSARAGNYRIENGKINFQSPEDADGYDAHLSKLQALVSQEDQLNKDIQAEEENSASKLNTLVTGGGTP